MRPHLLILLYLVATFSIAVADDPSLQEQNARDGVTVEFAPVQQTVSAGEELRFRYTYSFGRSGRYMNPFALTHNHFHPTGEIRLFRDDGSFYAILVAHGFAGNFPDHEYLMYGDTTLGISTTLPTATRSAITPNQIPAGRYKIQLATYDKLWLGSWVKKEAPANAVLFSNVVKCEVKPK